MSETSDPGRILAPLDAWMTTLLETLSPAERAKLLKRMGLQIRKANSARIAAQQAPDGAPWDGRKNRATGKVKRKNKMFLKLRQARHFKVMANAGGVHVGFTGNAGRIARVHHFGLRERMPKKGGQKGPLVKYAERQLLGLSLADQQTIHSLLVDHIAE